jgi:hypothetical protein
MMETTQITSSPGVSTYTVVADADDCLGAIFAQSVGE